MNQLRADLGQKGQAGESTASDKRRNDDESSSGSEEDDDFVASLPQMSSGPKQTGPRQSVSAEAFGKFNV